MLSVIQSQVISLLEGKITGGYPATVKPYTGALKSQQELKKQIKNTPVVHVGIREGGFEGKDTKGNTRDSLYTVNIYGFESNKSGKEENVNDGIALVEWILDSIKGETITVGARAQAINKSGKVIIEDDGDPFIAIVDIEVKVYE